MSDSIFGNKVDSMEGTLRDPNELREAFIYESLRAKGPHEINRFVKSPEAKVMLEQEFITDNLMDRLDDAKNENKSLELTVLHMAKENDDPEFSALLAMRAEERRMLNDLIGRYGESAMPMTDKYYKKFMVDELPKEFQ